MPSSSPAELAASLDRQLASAPLQERLRIVAGLDGRAVFTTSLGIEDQVITARGRPPGARPTRPDWPEPPSARR
ncbi:MAG: hypothetical protein ACK4UZ_13200, partial [Rhizobium rhizophilum]